MRGNVPLTAQHIQGENFSRLAFSHDFEGAATDLAISREALRGNARVDDQLEALAAERALDIF